MVEHLHQTDEPGKEPSEHELGRGGCPAEFTDEELAQVLASHALWLDSDGDQGEQADLRNAWLPEAELIDADLRRALLENANLTNADLTGADLRDADLRGATLSPVKGLQVQQLAGADLTDALVEPEAARFVGLDYVAEISRHGRGVFLGVVGGCVYAWLALATTTDLALVVNASSTQLPIIQTEVPIAGFFLAAPVVLLGIYIYLHMYLQRLWRGLSKLPAFFPDAFSLDEKAYPWLLTSLLRLYMQRLTVNRPPLWWLQVGISVICAWVLVPLTVFLFWLRYLPKHDWIGSFGLSILVVLAFWTGCSMYRITKATLLGERARWRPSERLPEIGVAVFMAIMTFTGSYIALTAQRPIEGVGFRLYADLQGAELNEVALSGINLRAANLRNAKLERADLSATLLDGADLRGTNLRAINLSSASVEGADFRRADLWYADLRKSSLRGSDFRRANLQFARFAGADLSASDLTDAKQLAQSELEEACGDAATKLPPQTLLDTCE
ncbi:pentapeptide repeat-containing protein [Pelagibius sp. Alg239-R121]|uniref:pentapeptide repeat-containing protein n=1 Tax=Pelagibius sp. Alg239-R121 TaxID=2993448 RepID=UPI0024A6361E|nr:pentapeptide repeat-containing protein [Pelagibius sp. Alg239-R121]